jgi:hypothetical protein
MSSAKNSNLQKGKAIRILYRQIVKIKLVINVPPRGTPDVEEKMFDLTPNNFTHCCYIVFTILITKCIKFIKLSTIILVPICNRYLVHKCYKMYNRST